MIVKLLSQHKDHFTILDYWTNLIVKLPLRHKDDITILGPRLSSQPDSTRGCSAINPMFEGSSSLDCEYGYKYVKHKLETFINNNISNINLD